MSAHVDPYRLSFMLPAQASGVRRGRHCPCLHGCVLIVERAGLVTIEGPSADQVKEQATRFLRLHCRNRSRHTIVIGAVMRSPPWTEQGRGGRDTLQILIGAEIAFVATSIPPWLPGLEPDFARDEPREATA